MRRYLLNLLLVLDLFVDTVLFGSSPFETISSRAFRKQHTSFFWGGVRSGIDVLFDCVFNQKYHCFYSQQPEIFWKGYEVLQ